MELDIHNSVIWYLYDWVCVFVTRDEVARKVQALVDRDSADLLKRQEEMQDLEMRLSEEQLLNKYKTKVRNLVL